MNKVCQNCKSNFEITEDDLQFYSKISVPAPQMCRACRMQRRLMFRNERTFYKRACDKCKKDQVSMYSPNKAFPVWCRECWNADDWDATDFGRDYDTSRPFFEQLQDLWNVVPKVSLIHVNSVNSDYINIAADNKNCYMLIESSNNEDCIHSYWLQKSRDCVDSAYGHQAEQCYETNATFKSTRLFYSLSCEECLDSYFLLDCRNCVNCIGCVNLRNKQYCIFNKQVTKEEYETFLREARLGTHTGVQKLREKCEAFFESQPKKYARINNAENSSGNFIHRAKNCYECFDCYEAEDIRYSVHAWRNAKDCMDVDTAGRGAQRIYNSANSGMEVSNMICCTMCWEGNSFLEYCYDCSGSQNCFGSVGLRKKKYTILNKEYSKEEYTALRDHIVEELRGEGLYAEYYPASMCHFGYNETAAQEQFPLTKEEAIERGYKWEAYSRGTYGKETHSWNDVPDSIKDLPKDFDINEAIFACEECEKNYRIIPRELQFYQKLSIPLPHKCPDCRHARRFRERGPNRTWKRHCQCKGEKSENDVYSNTSKNHPSHLQEKHCPNEFMTAYAPDRPEIVYCEQCYQAEVV